MTKSRRAITPPHATGEYGGLGIYMASRDGRTMFVIPADVKDSEFAGRITEALAVASHEYVIPAYYEVTLKTKTARDDDSYRMLDIIRSGFTLDFAAEYAMQTGQSGYMIRNALSEKKIIRFLPRVTNQRL